jgi:hypothetical protein
MSMNKKDNCLGCEFDLTHELTLTAKIMRVIAGYNQEEHIKPCSVCMRNTMLAVAALLHLEAAKLDPEKAGKPRAWGKSFAEAFVKAATVAVSGGRPINAVRFLTHRM